VFFFFYLRPKRERKREREKEKEREREGGRRDKKRNERKFFSRDCIYTVEGFGK